MLNRFGFGATASAIQQASRLTAREFFLRGITESSLQPAMVQAEIDRLQGISSMTAWGKLAAGGTAHTPDLSPEARLQLRRDMIAYGTNQLQALLLQLANGDNQAHEAMLVFWLNHFSIFAGKADIPLLAGDYARSLEDAMRADSFEALLRASFYHPAMQIYLDNRRSTAPDSPFGLRAQQQGRQLGINENLARELLELHTLGVGAGYSQRDVVELARIITGAGVYYPVLNDSALGQAGGLRKGLFLFEPRRHDPGSKHFLGHEFPAGRGIQEIDEALHLLASHPATARHISLKLARRFLSDQPPEEVVESMAAAFQLSGGRISSTLHALYESAAFQQSLEHPLKFREPLDFVLAVGRAMCGDRPITNAQALFGQIRSMGQLPLRRITPDGYGSMTQDWLSPVAMSQRLRIARDASRQRIRFIAGPASPTEGKNAPRQCTASPAQVEKLVGSLTPQTTAAMQGLNQHDRVALLLSSPEFMRR